MSRKSFSSLLLPALILLAGSIAIFGQTAPVSGKIMLQKADGTKVPVSGALIEVYRTDIPTKAPSGKSNKDGSFAFAGLTLGARYLFAVSAPDTAAQVFPNIKAGTENITITLMPGSGNKLTEAEARAAADQAVGTPAEMTAEEKKRQAEYEAKKKEIDEKNAKAQKANEIVAATFTAGNEAFKAKNYDLAIAKYSEGIAADPDFVGSAPTLNANLGLALNNRAVDVRNKAIAETDPSARAAGLAKATADISDSVKAFKRAYDILKANGAGPDFPKANFDSTLASSLAGAKESFKLAARTELVGDGVIEMAKVMLPEYAAQETDPVKKAEAGLIIADLYRVTGDYPTAVEAYKKVLETSPDNPDALAGAGLCLFAQGAIANNDKAMYQEGANFLQKYVSVAPEGHKYKADAVAILEQLKNEQKVVPTKTPSGGKKRGS
jgi:tetratricopeptide (TPR) repeat protein